MSWSTNRYNFERGAPRITLGLEPDLRKAIAEHVSIPANVGLDELLDKLDDFSLMVAVIRDRVIWAFAQAEAGHDNFSISTTCAEAVARWIYDPKDYRIEPDAERLVVEIDVIHDTTSCKCGVVGDNPDGDDA